jgi:chemosensory pili system protein ChpA (sensor histidine kinase/response regulator)
MELAIKRLADQLRRMEGELESQIIARHGGENSRYADFDPLEMDQYSSLNQLSKSLAESASDLVDFKTHFLRRSVILKACYYNNLVFKQKFKKV